MKRKIVQQGPTTLMVSLPIKWVKERGISKGDEVDLESNGPELVIRTFKKQPRTKTEITLDTNDGLYLWRVLQSLYIAGYDEIKINYTSKEILESVQNVVTSFLIGFEVISQGEKHCVIKQISAELNDEFETVFKRVFQTLLQMSEAVTKFLEGKDDLEIIQNLEKMNNRHVVYLKRVLIKERFSDKKTPALYLMIDLFEKIANEYKYIFFNAKEIGVPQKIFLKKYLLIDKELNQTYDLFYSYSEENLKKIILERIPAEKFNPFYKENPLLTHSLMSLIYPIRNVLFQVMALNAIGE